MFFQLFSTMITCVDIPWRMEREGRGKKEKGGEKKAFFYSVLTHLHDFRCVLQSPSLMLLAKEKDGDQGRKKRKREKGGGKGRKV